MAKLVLLITPKLEKGLELNPAEGAVKPASTDKHA